MLAPNLQPLADMLTAVRVKLSELSQTIRVAQKSEMVFNGGDVPVPGKMALSARAVTMLAFRNVELASMWLGKTKGIIGCENPYPASTDPSSPTIEKAVDVYEGEIKTFDDETVFVKTIRKELGDQEFTIRHSGLKANPGNEAYRIGISQAYVLIQNAKMYLGLVLGEIRDERPAPSLPAPEGLPEVSPEALAAESGALPEAKEVQMPAPGTEASGELENPLPETEQTAAEQAPAEHPADETPAPGDEEAKGSDTAEETPSDKKGKGGKNKK